MGRHSRNPFAAYRDIQQRLGKQMISVGELIDDTRRFLEENYRGCYKSGSLSFCPGALFVSAIGYAEFFRIIFKSVFASQMIIVSYRRLDTGIAIDFEFDTRLLSEEAISDLHTVAEESGFRAEVTERSVIAIFEVPDPNFSMFNAISTRIVYDMLKLALLS